MATDLFSRAAVRRALVALGALAVPVSAHAQAPRDSVVVPAPTPPPDPAFAAPYRAVGVAIGSPGYANLTVSHYGQRVVLRAAGGLGGGGRAGAQADLGWRFIRAGELSLGGALVGGTLVTRDATEAVDVDGDTRLRQPYAGAVLDLEAAGFRVQMGLAHHVRGTSRAAQMLARFGYEYRLGPRGG